MERQGRLARQKDLRLQRCGGVRVAGGGLGPADAYVVWGAGAVRGEEAAEWVDMGAPGGRKQAPCAVAERAQ